MTTPPDKTSKDLPSFAEVSIQDVAFGGKGIGRLEDGRVVFVPYTLIGEKVRVHLKRAKKSWVEADLLEVLTPSPSRIAPRCEYFHQCGGCQYQHAVYEEQLRIKQKQVVDTLARIGGIKELPQLHVEPAPQPWEYRNKISVHLGARGEVGFYARDGQTVVDVKKCVIATPVVNERLDGYRRNARKAPHVALTDAQQREGSPEGSFHQVNTPMAERLMVWVQGQIKEGKQLLDGYCGAGFFSFGLAKSFEKVIGIDADARAVESAGRYATKLKLNHVTFKAGRAEDLLVAQFKEAGIKETVVLLDPPREGLDSAVTQGLKENRAKNLIYVSCDPATLARDLKILVGGDNPAYRLENLAVFDMFPQTSHIETVAVLGYR